VTERASPPARKAAAIDLADASDGRPDRWYRPARPGLALRLSRGGLPVIIGSRDLQHAHDIAERVTALGGVATIRGATNADAGAGADLAILTVPYEAQAGLLPSSPERSPARWWSAPRSRSASTRHSARWR